MYQWCASARWGDELYTPRLAETVRDTLHALLPLYEFCLSAVG